MGLLNILPRSNIAQNIGHAGFKDVILSQFVDTLNLIHTKYGQELKDDIFKLLIATPQWRPSPEQTELLVELHLSLFTNREPFSTDHLFFAELDFKDTISRIHSYVIKDKPGAILDHFKRRYFTSLVYSIILSHDRSENPFLAAVVTIFEIIAYNKNADAGTAESLSCFRSDFFYQDTYWEFVFLFDSVPRKALAYFLKYAALMNVHQLKHVGRQLVDLHTTQSGAAVHDLIRAVQYIIQDTLPLKPESGIDGSRKAIDLKFARDWSSRLDAIDTQFIQMETIDDSEVDVSALQQILERPIGLEDSATRFRIAEYFTSYRRILLVGTSNTTQIPSFKPEIEFLIDETPIAFGTISLTDWSEQFNLKDSGEETAQHHLYLFSLNNYNQEYPGNINGLDLRNLGLSSKLHLQIKSLDAMNIGTEMDYSQKDDRWKSYIKHCTFIAHFTPVINYIPRETHRDITAVLARFSSPDFPKQIKRNLNYELIICTGLIIVILRDDQPMRWITVDLLTAYFFQVAKYSKLFLLHLNMEERLINE